MKKPIDVQPDVHEFASKVSDLRGRWEADSFSHWMSSHLFEGKMESPIEHLFFLGFHAATPLSYCEVSANRFDGDPCPYPVGLHIEPQVQISDYRVDFLVSYRIVAAAEVVLAVIELDGHAFHDRDKVQRSYEKRRDRELQRLGYMVLHFTGSDVVADPIRCGFEVLDAIGANRAGYPYDPNNPLGID